MRWGDCGFVGRGRRGFDVRMSNRLSETEIRRARLQCFIAAAVFGACGVGLVFAPIDVAPAVRWVGAGFNGMIALGVFLYGRQVGTEA